MTQYLKPLPRDKRDKYYLETFRTDDLQILSILEAFPRHPSIILPSKEILWCLFFICKSCKLTLNMAVYFSFLQSSLWMDFLRRFQEISCFISLATIYSKTNTTLLSFLWACKLHSIDHHINKKCSPIFVVSRPKKSKNEHEKVPICKSREILTIYLMLA